MGLLTGSLSVTRFRAPSHIDEEIFEKLAFRAIDPASEVKESIGFLPFEPEAPYRIGAARLAFRLRVDRRTADRVLVNERLKQLVQTEMESTGAGFVPQRKRTELRHLAEEELLVQQSPRSQVVDCCADGKTLWVASTGKQHLGRLQAALRRGGVLVDPLLPWVEAGLPEEFTDIPEMMDPSASIWGPRFLEALVGDPDFLVEPENGYVKLVADDTRITLSGAVLQDLHRYLKEDATMLAAKLLHGDVRFTIDATTFRLSALKLPRPPAGHWTDELDARLEQLDTLFAELDEKFKRLGGR